MDQPNQPIRVLGISASLRNGNSEYLLRNVLTQTDELHLPVTVEIETLRGKQIHPCIGCYKCRDSGHGCIIKDDFQELFLKWLEADVVIYSTPVYHMSIPGQLKTFFDRLGQSVIGYSSVRSSRHLKVVGTIVQGQHHVGGEEFAAQSIILHSVLMNCVPVSGDGWESYTCAAGCTKNQNSINAIEQMSQNGDQEVESTFRAAHSLVRRATETAMLLKAGGFLMQDQLKEDPKYGLFLNRI